MVVSVVWPALIAALLPLNLANVNKHLPSIIDRLSAMQNEGDRRSDNDRARPHQLDNFRSRYASHVEAIG